MMAAAGERYKQDISGVAQKHELCVAWGVSCPCLAPHSCYCIRILTTTREIGKAAKQFTSHTHRTYTSEYKHNISLAGASLGKSVASGREALDNDDNNVSAPSHTIRDDTDEIWQRNTNNRTKIVLTARAIIAIVISSASTHPNIVALHQRPIHNTYRSTLTHK